MKRYLPFAVTAVLLVAWGCGGGDEPQDHVDSDGRVLVQVFKSETQLAEEPVEYSASVEPADKANIGSLGNSSLEDG